MTDFTQPPCRELTIRIPDIVEDVVDGRLDDWNIRRAVDAMLPERPLFVPNFANDGAMFPGDDRF